MTPMPEKLWTYDAKLDRVIDGDTIVVIVDTGFSGRFEATVRLKGVWAPELDEEGGADGEFVTSEWLKIQDGSYWPLRIETYKTRTGNDKRTFTRYVGTVWRKLDGRCLNDDLIELKGWA